MFFVLMARYPPVSTLSFSVAGLGVYMEEFKEVGGVGLGVFFFVFCFFASLFVGGGSPAVSYTHFRAHETKAKPVCRLLLVKIKMSVWM